MEIALRALGIRRREAVTTRPETGFWREIGVNAFSMFDLVLCYVVRSCILLVRVCLYDIYIYIVLYCIVLFSQIFRRTGGGRK